MHPHRLLRMTGVPRAQRLLRLPPRSQAGGRASRRGKGVRMLLLLLWRNLLLLLLDMHPDRPSGGRASRMGMCRGTGLQIRR